MKMIKTIHEQHGKTDIYALGFIAIAVLIGAFVAGIAAYIFLKVYKINANATWKKIIFDSLSMALLVTFLMYIGSAAGYIIFNALFFPSTPLDQFDHADYALSVFTINAIPFFIESFLALLWAVFASKTFNLSKFKMWFVIWVGVFIVFNIGNIIVYFISQFTFEAFLSYGVGNLLMILPNTIYYQMEQAVVVALDPVGYLDSLWYGLQLSNGNQYFLVSQFPKWALLLFPLSIGVLSYRFLFSIEAES